MPRQQNIEAVKRASERFKMRDLEGHLEIYSPSVFHHGFSSRIKPGLPGLRDHYNELLKGFPDLRIEIEDIVAEDEKVVHRFTFYGSHRGEFMGLPPSQKMVTAPGVHIQWFHGGKCVEVWQVLDTLRFMSQVGAVPAFERRK